MGTRGTWGVKHSNGQFSAYTHYDGYPPGGLGESVCQAIASFSNEEIDETCGEIETVTGPAPEYLQRRYREYADLGVSLGSLSDWYCLLRLAQGRPELYFDGTIQHVEDFTHSQEWGYLIDLERNVLQVLRWGQVITEPDLDMIRAFVQTGEIVAELESWENS